MEERLVPHQRIHDLIEAGELRRADIVDLGALIAGRAELPAEPHRRVFLSNGMGIQDVAWACELHARAQKLGLGTMLKLWDTPYVN